MNKEGIRHYYNDHAVQCLLRDYVAGNPRLERALFMTREQVPRFEVRRILDIGCGIGYSSYCLQEMYPDAEIVGIDLSEKGIEIAKQLFTKSRLTFTCMGADELSELDQSFDMITMFDVYEHIPENVRLSMPLILKSLLSPKGWLVMSTPTIEHQNYLRTKSPEKIQVVDDDISVEELFSLAAHLNMIPCYFQRVSIFIPWDYQYFVCREGDLEFRDGCALYSAPEERFVTFFMEGVKRKLESILKLKYRKRYKHVTGTLGIDPLQSNSAV